MIPQSLSAKERQLDFLNGLRQQKFYDTALFYIEQQQNRTGLTTEQKARLEFERATILLESAGPLRNPKERQRRLDQASAALEQFVKNHPENARVGSANRELARVHLNNARVSIWNSQSSDSAVEIEQQRKSARQEIDLARKIFKTALPQLQKQFDAFLPTINAEENPTEYREKKQLEQSLINSRLELAKCTYEEAQTYSKSSSRYNELLNEAIEEFEALYQQFRTQTGGQYARLWQGKCYEEQGEITKALGIYNEVLSHPQTSTAIQILQDLAQEFHLICLNHDEKKQYDQAISIASLWLVQAKKRQYSPAGLGIRWQRAIAYEKLAQDKKTIASKRKTLLRQAMVDAETVQKFPGRYKGLASSTARRLQVETRGKETGPKDFAASFEQVQQLMNQLPALKSNWDQKKSSPNSAASQKAEEEYQTHLNEILAAATLAEEQVDRRTPPEQLALLHYYHAYHDYLTQDSYEAAVRGSYVARTYKSVDSETAQRASLIATASFAQAFNQETTPQAKEADLRMMEREARFALAVWPESDTAASCCQLLGQANSQIKKYREAAKWYLLTPAESNRSAQNRILAGQSLWQAALRERKQAMDRGEQDADVPSTLAEESERFLTEGIQILQKQLSSNEEAPAELITGKASLAELYVHFERYSDAIRLLKDSPFSVAEALKAQANGEAEVKFKPVFVSSVFKLLLRAYVGAREVEQALETMQTLEQIGKGTSGKAITTIYIQLGKELEKELNDLKSSGQIQKLAETRQTFEEFLTGMAERETGQTYASLLWVAETCSGLANSFREENPDKAHDFYEQSFAAYQTMLERGDQEADFLTQEQRSGIRLRLVTLLRELGRDDEAMETLYEVVALNPQSLKAQYEAAMLLESLGQEGDISKLRLALNGNDQIWGWANLAKRLQPLAEKTGATPDIAEKFYESRYHTAACRQQIAFWESDQTEKQKQLAAAEQELVTFFSLTPNIPQNWKSKYETLYQQLRSDQGKSTETLAARLNLQTQPDPANGEAVATDQIPVPVSDTSQTSSSKSTSYILFAAVIGVGVVVMVIIIFVGTRKGKRQSPRPGRALPVTGKSTKPKKSSRKRPTRSTGS